MITDQAKAIAEGLETKIDVSANYFKIYGNNNLSVVLLIFFYKLLRFLGITGESNVPLGILGMVCVDLSVFFLWRTSKLLKGSGFAVKLLLMSVMNPFSYVILYWSYTLVYSLPLTTGIVYLTACIDKKKMSEVQRAVVYGVIAAIIIAGYYIRPTVVIPGIALLVFRCLSLKIQRQTIKKLAVTLAFVVILSAAAFISVKSVLNHYVEESDRNFPVTHWIMMGLHDDGAVTPEDIYYTGSYATTEEMQKANIDKIKEILSEYNAITFTNHIINKMKKTWSEGTGKYYRLITADKNQAGIGQWIYGQKNDFAIIYCQAFRIFILLLAASGIVLQIRNVERDRHFWFYALTLFGAILFYIIWEAKEIYCVPFLPFLFLLSADSLEHLPEKKRAFTKPLSQISAILMAGTLLLGIFGYNLLTVRTFDWHHYVIYTESNEFYLYRDSVSTLSADNLSLSQTFYAEDSFTEVAVQCFPFNTESQCRYTIEIQDSEENIIGKKTVSAEDVTDNRIEIKVSRQSVETKALYKIKISPKQPETEDGIRWPWRVSKASDQYEGEAYLGDAEIPDLNIRVYSKYTAPYMKKWKYILCVGAVLIVELFFMLQWKRLKKE